MSEPPAPPPVITDDKSPICIPFILSQLQEHRAAASDPSRPDAEKKKKPFIIGLNGVQGVGKTTLVRALAAALRRDEGLETLVCSIDDFYLRRADQEALARAHPDNQLVQVRGEPGTHDVPLLRSFFASLCAGEPTQVPSYDKSLHGGRGDRAPASGWAAVNGPGQPRVQVVIFEGWCVGFRALGADEVLARWRDANEGEGEKGNGKQNPRSSTLRRHRPEHLAFVNEALRAYDGAVTDLLDAFIHVDAEDLSWVYDWRLEQEVALRREKGAGMTDDEVVAFVDAYFPAYELFTDKLRAGLFPGRPGRHLRLVVGKDRKVKQKIII
ncbi:P-loop containing nucleoside triphosphate hydrolase protein [Biscogniauxia mediterranea]|nr:P-loop containing nucleoside triphosphate hydrolase protein [Biscogniauxia mediterranea]